MRKTPDARQIETIRSILRRTQGGKDVKFISELSGYDWRLQTSLMHLINPILDYIHAQSRNKFDYIITIPHLDNFTATVVKHEDFYINLHSSVFKINDVFLQMSGYKELLSHDHSPELRNTEQGAPEQVEVIPRLDLSHGMASTEEHLKLATALTKIALLFLCVHEMAHIANGHLGYLSKVKTRLSAIEERVTIADDEDLNLTLQTLEFDADAFASRYVIQILTKTDFITEKLPKLEEQQLLRLFCVAIYTLFRAFDRDTSPSPSVWARTHPYAYERVFNSSALFATRPDLLFNKLHDADVVAQICRNAYRSTENWVGNLFDLRDEFIFSKKSILDSRINLEKRISRWSEIREDLNLLKLKDTNIAPA